MQGTRCGRNPGITVGSCAREVHVGGLCEGVELCGCVRGGCVPKDVHVSV